MRRDCGLQERNDWERTSVTESLQKKLSRCFAGRTLDQGYLRKVAVCDGWLLEKKERPWKSFLILQAILSLRDFQWTLRSTVPPCSYV